MFIYSLNGLSAGPNHLIYNVNIVMFVFLKQEFQKTEQLWCNS